ncbi:Crp/Fnr family transcriptional regulator [Deinococcus sonorensis]|uniref:Crp/Fnr family transcriptional regulator n=2 Tax=Deinococcus sonorensis TaxID=309891 RepID=A0AAU7U9J4_9DEIO
MLPGFFGALTTEARTAVTAAARTVHWTRGSLLHHSDDAADAAYALNSGHVRLYRLGSGAREVTVNVHTAGELLGMATLVDGSRYGLYAEAMDDVEALVLGGDHLRTLIRQHPDVAVALTAQVARQTRNLQERLSQLVFLEVSQRLALALLGLAHDNASELENGQLALKGRISHQDLAHTVGSTRETITKLLGDFRTRGLLDLGYRRIVITDLSGLEVAARHPLSS